MFFVRKTDPSSSVLEYCTTCEKSPFNCRELGHRAQGDNRLLILGGKTILKTHGRIVGSDSHAEPFLSRTTHAGMYVHNLPC